MTDRKIMKWPGTYRPNAPLTAGWKVGNLLFISGQIPREPDTGVITERDIARQTDRVIRNLALVLKHYDAGLEMVVRCTVYLTDASDLITYNRVYGELFKPPYPARSTLIVKLANPDYLIELDAIAAL